MQWKDGLNGTFDTHQVNGLNQMGHLIHIQWTDKMDVAFDLHPVSECLKLMGHLIHIQWMNGLDGKFGYTSSKLEWTGWDISHNIPLHPTKYLHWKRSGFSWDIAIIDIICFEKLSLEQEYLERLQIPKHILDWRVTIYREEMIVYQGTCQLGDL